MAEPSLRDRRQALIKRSDLEGSEFCSAYSLEADQWLSRLASRAAGESSARRLALVAVGGYGRSSLCPYSDLDVVLIHDGRRDISQLADAIWYPVWDQGIHLDHSVRKPNEVLSTAAKDLRVALGLLDARLIWGDLRTFESLKSDVIDAWTQKLAQLWLPIVREQMQDRRRTNGDVAFLLEPDLKESHGGLRDASILQAISTFSPALNDYADLSAIESPMHLLLRIRVALHKLAGRENNRLLLQDQDQIAEQLSYDSADALMQDVAAAGRCIAWVADDAWRRLRLWQPNTYLRPSSHLLTTLSRLGNLIKWSDSGGSGDSGDSKDANHVPTTSHVPIEVEPGIAVIDSEVVLTPEAHVEDDSSLAMRLCAVAAERDLPIAKGSLHRLADKMPELPQPWPIETREAFVRVLAGGQPTIDKIESLDHYGIFERILPEWTSVRNKPQRNAYHTYTVDRHLLQATANASSLLARVNRPDLLLIGSLLHDIGKGFPGDHTEVGILKVGEIAPRMGFSYKDTQTLVTMVRQHLLLPDVATRRDLDDPATITKVADAVNNRETLNLLAALTEADSLATGPSAWGGWKAGLVADLVERTAQFLSGNTSQRRDMNSAASELDLYRDLISEVQRGGTPSVLLDPPRVIVAALDRPGLLSSVAGVLALHSLDVRTANVLGKDAVALEIFTVEVVRGGWPDTQKLREDLEAALTNRLDLTGRLAEKSKVYLADTLHASAQPVTPDVVIDNEASELSSVIEIRTRDEIGLLHRVTQVLLGCGLDIISARVSTVGNEVVDAFYVRTSKGQKVSDPKEIAEILSRTRSVIE